MNSTYCFSHSSRLFSKLWVLGSAENKGGVKVPVVTAPSARLLMRENRSDIRDVLLAFFTLYDISSKLSLTVPSVGALYSDCHSPRSFKALNDLQ